MTDADADQGAIEVDFGDDGLVPAVAQDADSGEVLMLARTSRRRHSNAPARRARRTTTRGRATNCGTRAVPRGTPRKSREVRVDCDADTPCCTSSTRTWGRVTRGTARVSTGQSTVNTSASASTRTRCTDAGWGRLRPRPRSRRRRATLRERYDELARIEARIADLGRDRIETAADAYRRAHRVLDQYEEDAVGTGDFGSYVQFRGVRRGGRRRRRRARGPTRSPLRTMRSTNARLSETDFAAARDALEPAGNYVDLLADRDEALDDYRAARKAARERPEGARRPARRPARGRRDGRRGPRRRRGPAPRADRVVQRRGPRGVRLLYKSASARDVFSFLDRADGPPFVDADVPPTDLREYVTDYDGEEPLPTLLVRRLLELEAGALRRRSRRSGPRSRSTAPTSSGSTPSR